MVEYNKILTEPYNPIYIDDEKVRLPEWLSDLVIKRKDLPVIKNTTINDQIINKHASFYDATIWYPWLVKWTPKSIFMELNDDEVNDLIYEKTVSDEKKEQIIKYLDEGYNFIKSSKKSSHQCPKILNFDDFIEEITHPDIVMSFKKGCHHIFFRKFIENIHTEYRIYIYKSQIRYIEEYLKKNESLNLENALFRKKDIINYVTKVMKDIKYHDYILDICLVPENQFMVIEINTPMYLLGGIHLGTYNYDAEQIHSAENPIFRFKDKDDIINEI